MPSKTNEKSLFLSKTLWTNLLIAGFAMLSPSVSVWIKSNPEMFTVLLTGVNFGLRFITKDKLFLIK